MLARWPGLRVVAGSGWRETAAIGGPGGQGAFLNGAVLLDAAIGPEDVLAAIGRIENSLGRKRGERWGPRTIDLDLLLYGQAVLHTPALVVPHPRMAWRRFVLAPAAEVAADMVHPTTGWTIARLLDHLDTAIPYVAITGPIGVGKTWLAERLAEETSARLIVEQVDLEHLAAFYADPPGNDWAMELEFLHQRAQLLQAGSAQWSDRKRLVISDFWFDQSLAFAGVWLPEDRRDAFRRRWEEARAGVVPPKLTVLLDLPSVRLLDRVARRNRQCERGLRAEDLERIRQAILARADRSDCGPMLRVTNDDPDRVKSEVLAAVQAMR